MSAFEVYEISKRKTKLRQKVKNIIFWPVGFANWIVRLERYSKFAPKLVGENAVTRGHGRYSLRVMNSHPSLFFPTYSKLLRIITPSYYLTLGTTGIRP